MAAIDYLASENPSPFQVNFSMFPNTIPPFRFSNNAFLTNCPNPQLSPFQYFASQSSCLSNNATSDDAEEHQYHTIIDERKQPPMISSRESARRYRIRKQKHLDELWSKVVRLRAENSRLMEALNHLSEFHDKVVQENVRLEEELSELKEIFISMSFSPQENKLKAVKENKLNDKASVKENKDDCKASVKVYTRRVGQEVFWDKKLERHRTSKELEMDPGSLTAQSASSLHWPISLPDGGRVVSLLEKKIMKKTFKRKYNAIGVSFEDHEQHFSSRCDYAANSLGVKPICEQHGFNLVSTVKRIHRQYGIHRCTFRQGYSFGGERPAGVLSPSIEEKVVSRLQFLHISWLARSSRQPLALRSGSEISGHIAFSSSDFPATNKGAHPGRQDQCGSSASRPEKKRGRETKDGEGENNTITREDLEQHFGKKREEVADLLGVSVSTFKRICRRLGISEWPNWRRKSGNSSPSIQRICREQRIPPWPDWRRNRVFIPPDQNGENNPSPTFNTLSNNGQITTQNEMGGQHSEPNERLPDSFEDPNFQSIGNGSVAEFENHNTTHDSHHGHCGDANTGTGSVAEFENHNTIHDSHHGRCGDADVPFSAVQNQTEVAGGLDYFCEVFESSNFAFPVYSDAAAPSQPVPTILPTMPHSQIASTQILGENMESFEDWRNLLATQKEHFPEGHVSGSVNYTISSSQPMSTTPHSTESPEYLRYALASVVEHRMETNHYGSSNLIDPSFSNLAPSLPMQPTIPHMTPVLTERQDSTLVKLNATHGEDTIKLRLPLTSGIAELKQVVSKQLELGLDSFKVMYKDEYGEWIKITLDEEVREHLQLTLSGNQVSKLWVVNKVPNTTDFCCNCECDKCRSFKGNRP